MVRMTGLRKVPGSIPIIIVVVRLYLPTFSRTVAKAVRPMPRHKDKMAGGLKLCGLLSSSAMSMYQLWRQC